MTLVAEHAAAREICLHWYARSSFHGSEGRAAFNGAAISIETHCESLYRHDVFRAPLVDFRAIDRLRVCRRGAADAYSSRKPEKGVALLAQACDALLAAEAINRSTFAMALQATAQRRVP